MTPVTVAAGLSWSAHRANRHGPFEYNSNLYGVFIDATNNHVEVWKSTNSGASWAEADSANHQSATGGTLGADTVQVGSTLYILNSRNSGAGATWRVRTFSMSTDTWGAEVDSGIQDFPNVSGIDTAFLAVRSDGDYIVLHNTSTQSVMGNPYRRVAYSRYEGGAWTLDTDVDGIGSTAQHADARMIAMDAADRAYLFYTNWNTGALHLRTLTSANTLNAAGTVASLTNPTASYNVGHAVVIDDTTDRVVIPHLDASGNLTASFANVADSPSWSTTSVTTTNDPENTASNPASIALDGTTVHVFWPDASSDDLWRDEGTTAGGFGSDVEFQDAVTVQGISVGKITNAIGIFYLNAGTVTYDSYSLGGAGGATGTISVGTAAATGLPLTGTAGQSATGTLSVGTAAATGIAITGSVVTNATGTISVGTASATGIAIAGTDGQQATGTVSVGTAAATGLAVTGTTGQGATGSISVGTATASGLQITGTAGATGSLSVGTATATGIAITGTAGQQATGTISVGTAAATGVAITGSTGTVGTLAVGTAAATGLQITGTAGQQATGSISVGTASATGIAITGTAGATGTISVGGAASSGLSITGTAGQSATGTLSVGTATADGLAITGTGGAGGGIAPITHESFTTSTSATINKPTGTAVGDVLVASVLAAHSADAAIAGFTVRSSSDYSTAIRLTTLTRVVDGSEGSTFTATGGTIYGQIMHRYSGVDTTAVIEGAPTSIANNFSATATPASVTTVTNGAKLVFSSAAYVGGGTSADGMAFSGSMTEQSDVAGLAATIRIGLADETIPTAGATGTRTATHSHTGGSAVTFATMLALKPAATSPDATGTISVGTAAATGLSITGTAGQQATGTIAVGTAAATGLPFLGYVNATGTISVGTASASGTVITGSGATAATGSIAVGTASASGTVITGSVSVTGSIAVGTAAATGLSIVASIVVHATGIMLPGDAYADGLLISAGETPALYPWTGGRVITATPDHGPRGVSVAGSRPSGRSQAGTRGPRGTSTLAPRVTGTTAIEPSNPRGRTE